MFFFDTERLLTREQETWMKLTGLSELIDSSKECSQSKNRLLSNEEQFSNDLRMSCVRKIDKHDKLLNGYRINKNTKLRYAFQRIMHAKNYYLDGILDDSCNEAFKNGGLQEKECKDIISDYRNRIIDNKEVSGYSIECNVDEVFLESNYFKNTIYNASIQFGKVKYLSRKSFVSSRTKDVYALGSGENDDYDYVKPEEHFKKIVNKYQSQCDLLYGYMKDDVVRLIKNYAEPYGYGCPYSFDIDEENNIVTKITYLSDYDYARWKFIVQSIHKLYVDGKLDNNFLNIAFIDSDYDGISKEKYELDYDKCGYIIDNFLFYDYPLVPRSIKNCYEDSFMAIGECVDSSSKLGLNGFNNARYIRDCYTKYGVLTKITNGKNAHTSNWFVELLKSKDSKWVQHNIDAYLRYADVHNFRDTPTYYYIPYNYEDFQNDSIRLKMGNMLDDLSRSKKITYKFNYNREKIVDGLCEILESINALGGVSNQEMYEGCIESHYINHHEKVENHIFDIEAIKTRLLGDYKNVDVIKLIRFCNRVVVQIKNKLDGKAILNTNGKNDFRNYSMWTGLNKKELAVFGLTEIFDIHNTAGITDTFTYCVVGDNSIDNKQENKGYPSVSKNVAYENPEDIFTRLLDNLKVVVDVYNNDKHKTGKLINLNYYNIFTNKTEVGKKIWLTDVYYDYVNYGKIIGAYTDEEVKMNGMNMRSLFKIAVIASRTCPKCYVKPLINFGRGICNKEIYENVNFDDDKEIRFLMNYFGDKLKKIEDFDKTIYSKNNSLTSAFFAFAKAVYIVDSFRDTYVQITEDGMKSYNDKELSKNEIARSRLSYATQRLSNWYSIDTRNKLDNNKHDLRYVDHGMLATLSESIVMIGFMRYLELFCKIQFNVSPEFYTKHDAILVNTDKFKSYTSGELSEYNLREVTGFFNKMNSDENFSRGFFSKYVKEYYMTSYEKFRTSMIGIFGDERMKARINKFSPEYNTALLSAFAQKLGIMFGKMDYSLWKKIKGLEILTHDITVAHINDRVNSRKNLSNKDKKKKIDRLCSALEDEYMNANVKYDENNVDFSYRYYHGRVEYHNNIAKEKQEIKSREQWKSESDKLTDDEVAMYKKFIKTISAGVGVVSKETKIWNELTKDFDYRKHNLPRVVHKHNLSDVINIRLIMTQIRDISNTEYKFIKKVNNYYLSRKKYFDEELFPNIEDCVQYYSTNKVTVYFPDEEVFKTF